MRPLQAVRQWYWPRECQTARLARIAPKAIFARPWQVLPQTQPAAFRAVDVLVDRFVADLGVTAAGPSIARNLLGRPRQAQSIGDTGGQDHVARDLPTAHSARSRLSVRHPWEIAAKPCVFIVEEVPLQLAINRRNVPPKARCDLPDRPPRIAKAKDQFTHIQIQLCGSFATWGILPREAVKVPEILEIRTPR